MSKEFCPSDCGGQQHPKICNGRSPFEDGVRDRCLHLDDVLFDDPIPILLNGQEDFLVGENGGDYYTQSGFMVSKQSPLIRRV